MMMSELNNSCCHYPLTMHGVFLDVAGTGVLLTGESGIGKSELALGLLRQGEHRLIADDSVYFYKSADSLIGSCPPLLQDFLAIRDIGIINIKQLFGAHAICQTKVLQLIVKLMSHNQVKGITGNQLQNTQTMRSLADVLVPEQTLHVTPNRNLILLVETIARNHLLKQAGYDANTELITRHHQLLHTNKHETNYN